MYTWDMREAMKTYARSPVHSLCALCPSPPKDQLTKTANLDTQRGKSSQKHPGDMRDAIKTYARRTVHSLCNLCFSPPRNHLTKLLPWKPKGTHQAKIVLGYARSYKNIILWCATAGWQPVQLVPCTSWRLVDEAANLETQRDASSQNCPGICSTL